MRCHYRVEIPDVYFARCGMLVCALAVVVVAGAPSLVFALEEWEKGPVHEQDLAEALSGEDLAPASGEEAAPPAEPAPAIAPAPGEEAAAPVPAVPEHKPTAAELSLKRRQGWEWFGMNIGWGPLLGVEPSSPYGLKTDLFFFTLRRPYLYWTILELHPMLMIGDFGVASRVGCRIFLGDDYRTEIRLGLGAGYDNEMFSINDFVHTLAITPHVQMIFNHERWSWGLGVDISLHFHFSDDDDLIGLEFSEPHVTLVPVRVSGYLRFSFF